MPRRGWTLALLAAALLGGTLAAAPTASADVGEPGVRTITDGAVVRGMSADGQQVLLQGADLAVADGFAGTTVHVPDSAGGTALALDFQGQKVTWQLGRDVLVSETPAGPTRWVTTLPEGASIVSVGTISPQLVYAVREGAATSYTVVNLENRATTPLPTDVTSVFASAQGAGVEFVSADRQRWPDLPEGQAGVFRLGIYDGNIRRVATTSAIAPEAVVGSTSDADVVVLARANTLRVVNTWGFDDRFVDTAPDGDQLTDLRVVWFDAYSQGAVFFTGRVEGQAPQLYRWDWTSTHRLSAEPDGGPSSAGVAGPTVSQDGTTAAYLTADGPGVDAFGIPNGYRLHVWDLRTGEDRVLCCDRTPGTSRQFPSVAVGRSGGQIAWTTTTSEGERTSERWDRPTPRLTAMGGNTFERAREVSLSVGIEAPQHGTTRLRYESVGADPSGDLTGTSGVVEIPEGQRSVQVPIGIVDDQVREDDETFQFRFTWEDGRPGEAFATITISDDDAQPYLEAWFASAVEHDGKVTWNVTLDRPWDQPITVDYSAVEQWMPTARSGVDFVPTSGTVTFAPGQTSVPVSVPIIDDTEVEAPEYFGLQLRSAGVHYGGTTALGAIYDDDTTAPVVSVADAHAGEPDGAMTWVVSLDHRSAKDVTVAWRASADSSAPADRRAADGKDFRSVSGVAVIPAGATQVTVSAPVLDDLFLERDEWFVVELSSPSQATLGRAKATGTINDDESAAVWSVPRQVGRLLPA